MKKVCPECGMEFEPPGAVCNGVEYCCEGCAEGTGCDCAES